MENSTKERIIQCAMDSLTIESNAIADIKTYIETEKLEEAVNLLSSCPNIITCASGTSGIAAKKFAHSLCCIELNARFLSPSEAVHGGLGCIKEGDAVVMISRGGKTVELLPILDVCIKKKAKLIVITENRNSPLAQKAQIVILMKINRESDPLNIMATSSFIVTIAIMDAILAALMDVSKYTLEQFALIHPGGAVGSKLNK